MIGKPSFNRKKQTTTDVRAKKPFADDAGSVEHALRAESELPAKLKRSEQMLRSSNALRTRKQTSSIVRSTLVLAVIRAHDDGSLVSVELSV